MDAGVTDRMRTLARMSIISAVALCCFEVVRNWGAWHLEPASWIIDYIAGVFMVAGGVLALRRNPAKRTYAVLCAAWGGGAMIVTASLLGNLQGLIRGQENFGPLPQGLYTAIVGAAWVYSVGMLVWCVVMLRRRGV